MAQRTQVVFTDDIDGSEAAGTVRFGLAGATYEVDLSTKNADKLAKVLEPYIAAARKTGGSTRRAAKSPRPAGPSPQEVRTWARAEGIDVKDKGRVPAELIVRFQAAQ
jgi:Lsr2